MGIKVTGPANMGNPADPNNDDLQDPISVEGKPAETVDVNSIDDVVDDDDSSQAQSMWGKPADNKTDNPGDDDDDDDDDANGDAGDDDDDDNDGKDDPADYVKGDEDATEVFSTLTELLKEKGFFTNDVEVKSEEDLASAFEQELKSRLDSTTKMALEYMGLGVPQQEIMQIQSAMAETEKITPDLLAKDEKLATNLIYSEFKFRGFSDEDAAEYTDLIAKAGKEKLVAEATKALDTRKKNLQGMAEGIKEKYANQRKKEEEKHKEYVEELVKRIDSEEVFGRKLSPTTKEKLKRNFSTVVGYTESGEPVNAVMKYKLENPVDFEHKLLYLFTVTDGFKNLSAFERSAESKISRKLKNSVVKLSSGKTFSDKHTTPKTKIDLDTIDDIV